MAPPGPACVRPTPMRKWSSVPNTTSTCRANWEVRSAGSPFTYSVAMCQVALDRAASLATRLHLPGDATGWAG
jgi:GH15 family glucan-1,4-alpha-glucosidase